MNYKLFVLYLPLPNMVCFCSKRPRNKGGITNEQHQYTCGIPSDINVGILRLSVIVLNTCSGLHYAYHLLVLKEHQQEKLRKVLLLLCDHMHRHLCSSSRNRTCRRSHQLPDEPVIPDQRLRIKLYSRLFRTSPL